VIQGARCSQLARAAGLRGVEASKMLPMASKMLPITRTTGTTTRLAPTSPGKQTLSAVLDLSRPTDVPVSQCPDERSAALQETAPRQTRAPP
jgi:hypothetical protein